MPAILKLLYYEKASGILILQSFCQMTKVKLKENPKNLKMKKTPKVMSNSVSSCITLVGLEDI